MILQAKRHSGEANPITSRSYSCCDCEARITLHPNGLEKSWYFSIPFLSTSYWYQKSLIFWACLENWICFSYSTNHCQSSLLLQAWLQRVGQHSMASSPWDHTTWPTLHGSADSPGPPLLMVRSTKPLNISRGSAQCLREPWVSGSTWSLTGGRGRTARMLIPAMPAVYFTLGGGGGIQAGDCVAGEHRGSSGRSSSRHRG